MRRPPDRRSLLRAWIALAGLLATACAAPSSSPAPREEARGPERLHLVVLHVNDVHGQVLPRRFEARGEDPARDVGGLPRLAAEIRRQRDEARAAGAEVLLVDGGDWFQGTPEGALEHGRAFCAAYGALGFDALALGNHELDHGLEPLVRLLRESRLPAVCANLEERASGRRPEWIAPWRVVERAGWRIALVGLLTPQTPSITHPDAALLRFEEPSLALERASAELEGEVDWILPLTHLGLPADRELARAAPWLDLVVGGHSHSFLREGVREGNTSIVQVGTKARALGRVDLWLERPATGGRARAVRSELRTLELDLEPPSALRDPRVEALCEALVERTERVMTEVLGTLAAPATRRRIEGGSSSAGNLVADLFRARTGAHAAVMNRGGLRSDLGAGPLTRRDVFDFLPFDNHLVTLTLDGAELRELVRRGLEDETHSGLEVSGLVLRTQVADGRTRLLEARLVDEAGERPLEPERLYRVTLNSFLANGGDDFLPESAAHAPRELDPILMRELLEEALRARGVLHPPEDQRILEVAP